jgi:hypothetical protein
MGTKGCWSGNKPKFTENNNLPFDADGTTFESTSGILHANIQRRATGGSLTGGWWKSGNTSQRKI